MATPDNMSFLIFIAVIILYPVDFGHGTMFAMVKVKAVMADTVNYMSTTTWASRKNFGLASESNGTVTTPIDSISGV